MLEKTRDNEIHVEIAEAPPAKSIAFGLERLGLIPLKAPILSCLILAGLIVGAVFGIDRIKIDDSLSQLFRSETKEFRQYEEVTKRFPSTEYDVLVVIEGKTLSYYVKQLALSAICDVAGTAPLAIRIEVEDHHRPVRIDV